MTKVYYLWKLSGVFLNQICFSDSQCPIFFFKVSSTLNDLDSFLKRIEPGIEAITGEEQDIDSFMRLMRVFNEVT